MLSDEQMSNGLPFSLLNDEQMSNKIRVEQQSAKDQLPDGWGAERFKILDGGAGRIGFKGWNGQCLGRTHGDF